VQETCKKNSSSCAREFREFISNSKRTRAEYSGDVEIQAFKDVGVQMQILGDFYRKRQRLGLVKEFKAGRAELSRALR
jgi:hypothetical protein